MQLDPRLGLEGKVCESQLRYFLSPCTGVVEKKEQRSIAQSVAPCPRQLCEQGSNLVAFEEARCRWSRTFLRDRRNPLRFGKHLRYVYCYVTEECVQCGEPLVTGVDVVPAIGLEMSEKLPGPICSEVDKRQSGDFTACTSCNETKK
jgi:hypothetical protein